MNLDYLKKSTGTCNLLEINKILDEREEWKARKKPIPFQEIIDNLPKFEASHTDFSSTISIKEKENTGPHLIKDVEQACLNLRPWRKGPFDLFGIEIDAEWRSDLKWQRIEKHLDPLEHKSVLDIGCNNGYFMFQMAKYNPAMVLGIDPVAYNWAQFTLLNTYSNQKNLHFELLGVEHLNHFKNYFDVIFSMGILYHHRNPIEQLETIRDALVPGGQVILETIGIPGDDSYALFPEDRYAKMRNVWFIPTLSCFINLAKKSRFVDIELIDSTPLTFEEQRITDWGPKQSLEHFLDREDPSKTIEGHPAPMRFCIKARRRR